MPHDEQPDQLSDFIRLGWIRWTPRSGMELFLSVLALEEEGSSGTPWEQPTGTLSAKMIERTGGVEGDPWHTGDFLQDSTEQDETQQENLFRERLDQAARELGLQPITSIQHCFDFLLRVGLIRRLKEGGLTYYRTVRPVPIPVECIPMTDQEREEEDTLRWRELHERNAQRVIRLFVERDFTTLISTLRGLAIELKIDPESARYAVLNLVMEGDFIPDRNFEDLPLDEEFQLTVDWKRFNEDRISVSLNLPGKDTPN